MIRVLDRYIGLTIISSTLTVMLVLVALFTFFTFAGELNKTGKGSYESFQAAQFALTTIPGMLYQLFPASALIGTMMGLGLLANNSELIAMRAAGYSLLSLLRSVFFFGIALMLLVFFIGEYVAPKTQEYAETKRSLAMSGKKSLQTKSGLWIRDGMKFIRIASIGKTGQWSKVSIYEVDEKQKPRFITLADEAVHLEDNQWLLKSLEKREWRDGSIITKSEESSVWPSLLSPELLNIVTVKPEMMSAFAALAYADYLADNGIDSRKYMQSFWSKVTAPFATAIMVLMAIPFIFGSMRAMSAGHRILLGTLTGIGFYLFNQVFAYVGLVFEFSPFWAATLPTFLFFGIAVLMMRRIH